MAMLIKIRTVVLKKAERIIKKVNNFTDFQKRMKKIDKSLSEEKLVNLFFEMMINKIPKEKFLEI
jgi:hypothetical protein